MCARAPLMPLLHLLVPLLHLLCVCRAAPGYSNGFFYHDIGNGEIHFNGVKLLLESSVSPIFATQGSNVTLTCRYRYEPEVSAPRRARVKWFWLPASGGREANVLVAMGQHQRSFGAFRGRARLRRDGPGDASLFVDKLSLSDAGRYRCEIIDGLEDDSITIDLELQGVVFPYQPREGRYQLSFASAQQACNEQDSTLATFEQLFNAWEEGLDWCNAGWLADGTVQYPITVPRGPCGGRGLAPGVRSYGPRHHSHHLYDAFCFSSSLHGVVYFLQFPLQLNFTEAAQACQEDGSQIAKVGQLHAVWKFLSFDHCEAGWLADGSLRYPIAKPRPNCGPLTPGVRTLGFPPHHHKHGVYCFRAQ